MGAGKKPYLRYRIIDACFSNSRKRTWTKQEILDELAKHDHTISLRTLDNDFYDMRNNEQLGYYAEIESGPNGFFYKDPNYTINSIPLTTKELRSLAFALTILQKYSGIDLVNQFEAAFHKVAKVVNQLLSPKSKKKPVIAFGKAPYYKGLKYFDLLHLATEEEQPLRITYRKFADDKDDVHVFHPYFMKEYKGRLYVTGFSELRGIILTFGLDRMEKVEEEKTPFRPNNEVDSETYLDHAIGITLTKGGVKNIELRFSVKQGHYIKTQHLHQSQKILQDDKQGLVISLQLIPNYELTSLILSYGPEVEVLKPASLRQEIKKVFEKGRELYSD